MISNFSEVEKSLKRCLKEKVSITAATVVGFLIAGTVALGAGTEQSVTVTSTGEGKITISGVLGNDTTLKEKTDGKITIKELEAETVEGKSLAGLLTVEVVDKVATIEGIYASESGNYLGDLSITSGTNQAITFLSTDESVTSITSGLKVGVTGNDAEHKATAMEATNAKDKVTNTEDGVITVNAHAVGMKANAEAIAENVGTITVTNADGVGMLASGDKAALTNLGTITVTKGIGMSTDKLAKDTTATLTNLGTIDVQDGTGIVVDGAGTVNIVGTKEATATDTEAGKPEIGTIKVTAKQTGISVAGTGTTTITGGAIEVESNESSKGIDITGKGTTTVTGTAIALKGAGTGINATGNVKLEDIAITFNETTAGTGIVYDASEAETATTATISTKDMDLKVDDTVGIDAKMSGIAGSTLGITTGTIKTVEGATGIKIVGKDLEQLKEGETPTTATVTTTLGKTEGTGVAVTGKANNDITINLEAADVVATASEEAKVSGTGVEITSNEAAGKVVVNVNQKNLSVATGKELVKVAENTGVATINAKQAVELLEGANLVNVTTNAGDLTVNLDADKQSVAAGSLVNIAAATDGTIDVNVNKNVELETGNIVKAVMTAGKLNVNLNVEGEKGLNVIAETTALDLSKITSSGTASVKNTGSVTIEGQGTLVKGDSTNVTSTLTNQGLITVDTTKGSANDNSHISAGKVAVNNYGTIKLNITSAEFITASEVEKKPLEDFTLAEVKATLEKLGVIAADTATGDFSTVGYIEFSDKALFTTAQKLEGNQTVENLIATLKQQSEEHPEAVKGFRIEKATTLSSTTGKDILKNVQFNLNDTMTIGGTEKVTINNTGVANQINITGDGQLKVNADAALNYSGNIKADDNGKGGANNAAIVNTGTLTLSNGTLNMVESTTPAMASVSSDPVNRVAIFVEGDKITNLESFTVNGNILGELNAGSLEGTITSTEDSAINNKVTDIKTIAVENGMLTFGANSKIVVSNGANKGEKTTINLAEGKMKVELGENGVNVLQSSEGSIKFEGTYGNKDTHNTANKGKVVLATSNLTEDTTFTLGNHEGLDTGDITANGDMYYTIVQNPEENREWTAKFNNDLLLNVNNGQYAELNNIYAATQSIHDLLSDNLDVRATELDNIYSNNIYSETVKMSLDTLKMNEDAVLSLNVRPKQGEFTAQGKFLFNNTDYDREGVTRDYKVETKNNGLLGALEYGLTDTSSVGFAFSGTKQDLDMKNGASADGDAFYFGLYRNDTFNNIDLTTGLGYMTDRVDAKSFVGKDKFDSTAFSGYIQGKYNYAIAENLTLSPKAKLTVTRFQQDSINTGRMKQEEIKDTMADVELGVELKKGIALETGKMNLLAGASFTTNIAGKDDDFYKVDFISKTGNARSTRVKGANLEKNSLKLNIGADVELTNGVFYNGGLSYEFDDEDRDSIGVTLGAGYKF